MFIVPVCSCVFLAFCVFSTCGSRCCSCPLCSESVYPVSSAYISCDGMLSILCIQQFTRLVCVVKVLHAVLVLCINMSQVFYNNIIIHFQHNLCVLNSISCICCMRFQPLCSLSVFCPQHVLFVPSQIFSLFSSFLYA